MPYLSRVLLNPGRAETRRFFADPQLVKGAILGEFARQPVTERVLWRLGYRSVPGHDLRQGELLILTESHPSWAGLVERVGYPGADGGAPLVRDYEPLLATVAVGREFAFRVQVNPVQNASNLDHPTAGEQARLVDPGRTRPIRVAHRTEPAQTEWFLSRCSRWGFEIPQGNADAPDMRVVDRTRFDFGKGREGARHRVRLGTATFEGRLRVVDSAQFTSSLLAGVGPAKGYGCGLITLARLRRDSL